MIPFIVVGLVIGVVITAQLLSDAGDFQYTRWQKGGRGWKPIEAFSSQPKQLVESEYQCRQRELIEWNKQ